MADPQSISLRSVLLDLRQVTVLLPGEGQIGPIDWTLERGRRIRVQYAHEAQWEALLALLSGQHAPASGSMEELNPVRVQTDTNVRALLTPNRTLREFLESPDAPETVWLGGRRRTLWVMVDALGITPAMTRRAHRYLEPAQQDKVWALRFLLSRASLLVARDLLRVNDPEIQAVFARRWGDLSGTLIAAEGDLPLPGPTDEWVRFDADGTFTRGADTPPSPSDEPGSA